MAGINKKQATLRVNTINLFAKRARANTPPEERDDRYYYFQNMAIYYSSFYDSFRYGEAYHEKWKLLWSTPPAVRKTWKNKVQVN